MKIKKSLTLPQKYFNEFQNYFHNANEELASYTYISNYLRKNTERNSESLIENYSDNECLKNLIDQNCLVYLTEDFTSKG